MMEEAKAMAQQQQQQQQQQLLFQQQQQQQQSHHQQHQHQQQFMFLQQQLQKQHQLQSSAMSRFPSSIDAHLRPLRPPSSSPSSSINVNVPNPNPNPNPSPIPNPQIQQVQNQNQQQRAVRGSNHVEVQMAYQDAWRVSHPDFKRPFSSLHDACDRLLAYHVVADYEAEEDDRILDSDTTGQMPSRSQQWDHNISAKVAEFTATFEKQALAFNIISRKRGLGEFRSEERMMIEQAMCQEEKRAYLDLKAEIESREKAKMRMAEHARAELISRGPIRANALGAQGSDVPHPHHADDMPNGWASRDDKEPSEDFLNDEETDNADDDAWRDTAEFDLNTR